MPGGACVSRMIWCVRCQYTLHDSPFHHPLPPPTITRRPYTWRGHPCQDAGLATTAYTVIGNA